MLHALLGLCWAGESSLVRYPNPCAAVSPHACACRAPGVMAVRCYPVPFAALLQAYLIPSLLRPPWLGTQPFPSAAAV